MKLYKLALLAVMLSGCIQGRTLERQIPTVRPQTVTIDHAGLKKLTGSTARYLVRSKIFIATDKGVLEHIQNHWTGSAFCIGFRTGPDGVRKSIWITCKHVTDAREILNSFAEIDYRDIDGQLKWAKVDEVLVSNRNDIAVFSSLAVPAATLELADSKDVENFNLGDFLIIAGHPAGAFPTAVSVGVFVGYAGVQKDLRFTTFGTYGTSGSPLIDAATLKVVGVVYRFAGGKYRWGFRADDLYAVSANAIRRDFSIR